MTIIAKLAFWAVVIVGATLFLLYLRQDGLVFPKRHYHAGYEGMMLPGTVPLEYTTSCGNQKGWYVPPRSADDATTTPARLWVMFGGNGSVALSWKKIVEFSPDADAGFLLLDYPGYGFCEGEPSVDSIAESADGLVHQLARHIGISYEELMDRPVRVMGHSLGSGMATAFALRHRVDRIVMIAPFTSLRAMADGVVTPAFGWILRHKWDNIGALRQLFAGENPPEVIVVHGTADEVVPVRMGRAIRDEFPDQVEYVELDGADHGTVLDGVWNYMAHGAR